MERRILASHRPPSRIWVPRGPRPWVARLLLGVGLAAITYLLWLAPGEWTKGQQSSLYQAWINSVREEPVQVGTLFTRHPEIGEAFPYDPVEVKEVLEAHPTLEAAVRRKDGQVFVRRGTKLEAAEGTPFLAWTRQVEAAQVPQWQPPPDQDPESRRVPTLVLLGPRWAWIKRWRIGSPAAEAHLRLALGPHSKVRMGVWRLQPSERLPDPCDPASASLRPPNLQTCPNAPAGAWNSGYVDTVLGPDWEMVFQPWPGEAQAWSARVDNQSRVARLAALGIALCVAAGLWLQRLARGREAQSADRLASLTHGLKTPLAMHKLRCDTLRMGRLGPAEAAEELMKLGQEVDDLTLLIEQGLQSHKHGNQGQSWEAIGRPWFEEVAEEMRPAFEAEGRELRTDLAEAEGRAHPPSLRFAIQTLLENAFEHGGGTVSLRTERAGGLLRVEVRDEGSGMEEGVLASLGGPRAGVEGRPGRGLGLSLLAQMARQEGWGLELENRPGQGLAVTLHLSS